jgi:hypothetical protein
VIWKAIALVGSGSFFFVGWGVLTDPLCNSVSFRGGGARTVVTTCFPDSRGDFSKASAVTGSFLIGLAILAILFWPLIRAYIVNSKFQLSLKQRAREIENSRDIEVSESSESPQGSTHKDSLISISIRKLSENKLISILIVTVLIFGFYKASAPNISLLNPITCSGLKKELAAQDVQGRQIWNEYQSEVSRLGLIDATISYDIWRNQVGNVHRRAVQLISNELKKYETGYGKPHCVNIPVLDYLKRQDEKALSVFAGQTALENGIYWTYDYGWPTGYRKGYVESKVFLK